MKTLVSIRNIVGTVGLVLGGYVLLKSIPDIQRYIRISKM